MMKKFIRDVNDRTKRENIRKLMFQALKHLTQCRKHEIKIESISLVTNYLGSDMAKYFMDQRDEKNLSNLKSITVKLFGIDNINGTGIMMK